MNNQMEFEVESGAYVFDFIVEKRENGTMIDVSTPHTFIEGEIVTVERFVENDDDFIPTALDMMVEAEDLSREEHEKWSGYELYV
jgi:hypothetical protein